MPRNAKRPTPPAMPATSPGQPYGVAGEQRAAMASIPLPMTGPEQVGPQGEAGPPPAGLPAGGPPGQTPALTPDNPMSPIAAALSMPAPEGDAFADETAFPDEPVTAGLPTQQFIQPQVPPVANTLRMMAATFGNDPDLLRIADDAQKRGL